MSRRQLTDAAPAGTSDASPAGTHGSHQSSSLASNFVDPKGVYGNAVRVSQDKCMNQVVLIEGRDLDICQSGIIISCGDTFCYILTVTTPDIKKAKSLTVTFGDGTEKEFTKSKFDIRSRRLSIIYIDNGIETIQNKDSVKFGEEKEEMKDTVIYTMGVVPKFSFCTDGIEQHDPAVVCVTGGNVSFAKLEHENMEVIFHNCTLGDIAVPGSAVLSEKFEIVGINFANSSDSTMALTLEEIKYQIHGLFYGMTLKMTFVDIQKHLDARAKLRQPSKRKRTRKH